MPYGINAFATVAVEASLRAGSELARRIDEVVAKRDRLRRQLESGGWRVPPSHTNFLWLAEPDRVEDCQASLERAGVLARHHSGRGTRLTIGARAANDAVLAALGVCV